MKAAYDNPSAPAHMMSFLACTTTVSKFKYESNQISDMVLSDSDPKKWILREHTRVKHEILDKYLTPWIYKLGSRSNRLLYIDGFAGRGEYVDEDGVTVDVGSPIIAMRKAQEHKDKVPIFKCKFIENNENNYNNLCRVVNLEKRSCPHPKIETLPGDFETEMIKLLDKYKDKLPPTFCFIDPFGFDAPFTIIKRLMGIPRTEIFFNFMLRDINRFLSSSQHHNALFRLYGNDKWKDYNDESLSPYERERGLVNLYRKQLHEEAEVQYTMPFMVRMPEKRQTAYYLIHATNKFDGFKIMKEIMSKKSSGEVFGYLGPENGQTSLGNFDLTPLRDYLLKACSGQDLAFDEIIYQYYNIEDIIQYVEKDYRNVLKGLEREKIVEIERVTSKPTGKGLSGKDRIIFF